MECASRIHCRDTNDEYPWFRKGKVTCTPELNQLERILACFLFYSEAIADLLLYSQTPLIKQTATFYTKKGQSHEHL